MKDEKRSSVEIKPPRKNKILNLTEGSLFKKILIFSLPLMLSNVLQVLFNLSDLAVVGRFAGGKALGSVGSTVIYVTLFTGILIGIGSGGRRSRRSARVRKDGNSDHNSYYGLLRIQNNLDIHSVCIL